MRKWLVVAVALVLALIAGGSAAGQWRTFLMWRNRQDFGTDDPYFERDIGVFDGMTGHGIRNAYPDEA